MKIKNITIMSLALLLTSVQINFAMNDQGKRFPSPVRTPISLPVTPHAASLPGPLDFLLLDDSLLYEVLIGMDKDLRLSAWSQLSSQQKQAGLEKLRTKLVTFSVSLQQMPLMSPSELGKYVIDFQALKARAVSALSCFFQKAHRGLVSLRKISEFYEKYQVAWAVAVDIAAWEKRIKEYVPSRPDGEDDDTF